MTRSRILARGLVAVLGATVSLCLVTPAYAETIDLVCSRPTAREGDQVLYVSIDTNTRNASMWYRGGTRNDAWVSPATITDHLVTWTIRANRADYTLDRSSGALIEVLSGVRENPYACTRAARVF